MTPSKSVTASNIPVNVVGMAVRENGITIRSFRSCFRTPATAKFY